MLRLERKGLELTIQDRIVEYLEAHPEGVDDDSLTVVLGLRQRQQANQRCRRLEQFGIVSRRRIEGKIRNFLNPGALPIRVSQPATLAGDERPWYWEGNVQAQVVRHLCDKRYSIVSAADTASKQQGKDIVAVTPSGQRLWVSAKGYPKGTVRTNSRTQARHWFAHALFDLVLWHQENPSIALALAMPEQPTYRNLAHRSRWFLAELKAQVFWVVESGEVLVEKFGDD